MGLTMEGESNSKFINIKVERKGSVKNGEAKFAIITKNENGDYVTSGYAQTIEGKLIGFEKSKSPYEDGFVYGATPIIQDGDEIYYISTTVTNMAKGMLNGLLSLSKGDYCKIYGGQNKNNTYPKTGCLVENGQFAPGVKTFNEMKDVADIKEFFHNEIDKWNEKFPKEHGTPQKEEKDPNGADENPDESVPF